MTFKEDILRKINSDFGEKSNEVIEILSDAIKKTNYLETDRIVRCIIFLSKGNIDNLNKFIEMATLDPRDIMLWAEYEKLNDDFKFKRIRNFGRAFDD